MKVAAALITTTALIFLTGCRGAPPAEPATTPSPTSVEDVSSDPGRIVVNVSGETTFLLDQTLPIQIYIGGQHTDVPENFKLLSVGLLQHVQLEDGRWMRLAFDLLGYVKDGRFSIEKTAPVGGGTPASDIRSNVFVEIIPANQDFSQMVRYDILLADCDLETSRRSRQGKLVCPQIQHGSEGIVSLSMEWDVPAGSA